MVSGVFFLTGITFTFLLPVVKNIDMSRNFFLGAMQVRLKICKPFFSLNLKILTVLSFYRVFW